MIGKIVLHQTGGFAGVSKITTIEEKGKSTLLTSVDEQGNQTSERRVSAEDLAQIWQTLEANGVFMLPSNAELLDTVVGAFFYEISVERGEKQHEFSVYAPDILASETGKERYSKIVRAIQGLSDSDQFVIDDLPIIDVSLEIMESFPIKVAVVVDGFLRDSCTTLNEISEGHEGNTVDIQITTKCPKDLACAQVITEIQERILLGTFPPGDYTAIVNGVERKFSG